MVLNRIFNVHEGEWGRIGFAWLLRFLYRLGFVVGWTVIVAMFVGRNGIVSLPYLFIINAGLTMLGSFIFSFFVDRLKKETLLVGTAIFAALLLFSGFMFGGHSEFMFFGLLLVAEAIFLVQFKIILDGYVEEMFNPLESERTFPLIEASETTAGILAGLIIMLLSGSIDTSNFLLLWVGLLILIVPVVVIYCNYFDGKVFEPKQIAEPLGHSFLCKMKNEFFHSKHAGFVRGLLLVVMLQWLLYNLLEFQYTKAVYQNVSDMILDGGSGFEHVFVHDLGTLFVLFSSSALAIQLFVGSRLINYLGIIGSMLLHAIATFLSVFGMFLHFSFPTAILAKNNFAITSIIYTNAYHSAYYAIRDRLRDHARELFEGIVRPIGAIFGTGILIILQKLLTGSPLVFSVNLVMIFATLLLFYTMYLMQHRYTASSLDDLAQTGDLEARINAIDILSQRGHRGELPTMIGILLNEDEVVEVRVCILRAFGELSNSKSIPSIIECFESKNPKIRAEAVDALLSFKNIRVAAKMNLATSYDLVSALKGFYKREKSDLTCSKIIRLLSKVSNIGTLEFLLDILKSGNPVLKQHALYALGNYNDESLIEFIWPYLSSKSVGLKTASSIVLWKYHEYSDECEFVVSSLLRSKKVTDVIHGIFAVGELKLYSKTGVCEKYLEARNLELRAASALALAKMGDRNVYEILAHLTFSRNKEVAESVVEHLKNVDVRICKNVDKIIKRISSAKNVLVFKR